MSSNTGGSQQDLESVMALLSSMMNQSKGQGVNRDAGLSWEDFQLALKNSLNRTCDSPEKFFSRTMSDIQRAKNSGPPPVYSATLPKATITTLEYNYFHMKTNSITKTSVQGQATVLHKNTMMPSIEHGIAPPIKTLENTSLKDVAKKVNHIHNDKRLFVKTVHSSTQVVALHTLVEDDAGDRIMMALYNYDLPLLNGTYLAILAPYMRNSRDDRNESLFLRCDNPQCIIQYDSKEAWEAAKAGRDPPPEKLSPSELRQQGNDAFKRGMYHSAKALYMRALKCGGNNSANILSNDDATACLGNLAETCLRLQQWEDAEMFANRLLCEFDPDHAKGRFRRAKALIRLNRPDEALPIIRGLLQKENNSSSKKMFSRLAEECDRAVAEKNGSFDFFSMREEVKRGENETFHADYVSPLVEFGVEIETAGGTTYRGCRAKSDLSPGTLLCASKAFAYAASKTNLDMSFNPFTSIADSGHTMEIVSQMVGLLIRRPQVGRRLYELSAGDKFSTPVNVEDMEKLDIPRIRHIVSNNAFSAGTDVALTFEFQVRQACLERQNMRQLQEAEIKSILAELGCGEGSGLWLDASLFNHSCSPNCTWWGIGEYLFILSNRAIVAGEELCLKYTGKQTFNEVEAAFKNWVSPGNGFSCVCRRCVHMREDKNLCKMEEESHMAYQGAPEAVGSGMEMADVAEISMPARRRKEVIEAYKDLPLVIQHEAVRKVLIMEGICLAKKKKYKQALRTFEKAALVGYAVRGMSGEYPQDLWRVVGSALDCNDGQKAIDCLRMVYTYYSSMKLPGNVLNEGFALLTQKYALSFCTKLHRGSEQQFCALIQKAAMTGEHQHELNWLEKRLEQHRPELVD